MKSCQHSMSASRLPLLSGTATLAISLGSGIAQAQTAAPAEAPAAASRAPAPRPAAAAAPGAVTAQEQIADIVVTARRTEEASQRVPLALTALSQGLLQQQAVLSVQDLQTSTPGLFITTNTQGGIPQFAIRGAKTDQGTSPTVAVYIDDVPVVSTLSIANMVYDMQSITTLKGPQGTLFGATSTGGAIVFRPNKPTDKFEGYVSGGYGNYDRKELQGVVNIPVSEILQVRVAGELVRRDGFFKNISPLARPESRRFNNDRHESARLSVRLRPTDNLTNDTVIDYFNSDGQPGAQYTEFYRPRFDFATFLGFTVPVDFAKAGLKVLKPFQTESSGNPFYFKAKLYGGSNTTSWDTGDNVSSKLILGYRHDDTDSVQSQYGALQYQISDGRVRYRNKQFTVEPSTTFSWADDRWSNKVGLFYSDQTRRTDISYRVLDMPFDFTGIAPATVALVKSFYPLDSKVNEKRDFKSVAIYDQLSVKLSDETTVRGGLRYTRDKAMITVTNRTAFPTTLPSALGPFGDYNYGPCDTSTAATYDNFNAANCTATRSFKKNALSYSLSFENQFDPRKLLYASFRGGYLVGGFNNPVPVREGQIFGPERATVFEGGLKADWSIGGRPLRTNVAIFYGNYQGQQRTINALGATGTGYVAVQNAGSSRFYGTDTDITFKPFHFLTLNAAYSFLIAEYTNYNAALTVPFITASLDLTGQQAAQAPKHIVTASATLDVPIPEEAGALSATLSYFYRSGTRGKDSPSIGGTCANGTAICTTGGFVPDPTQDFSRFDRLPGFGVFNLSAQWQHVAGSQFDLELFVKNVTQKLYRTSINANVLTLGVASYQLGDPRTFGGRVRFNF